ncbi:sulfatase-like hydrolase/transferase [Nocardioides sp. S-58]|uniref:Sulfatase-like hydrolase/transferase n=1 Tax=Nocardioides renjunii TaxID=3095075 RepID=A0ABU5KAJ7_9ACTN|nr:MULTISPECIES: sulfatase-like hydrolase/transferase [unclassified Nocardioides]MDZ5661868.1 sulfatase-like hydrolase/transferase [Nocardioides sp. S-58]WQQ24105.1 sulfatase-like hydrolase/transferase [Nocardioides sp. S-34]
MVDNVLWIITDDQMRWTLSRMPRTRKRLVGKGAEFSRGYAAVPLCGPARASILTSRYPHDHGCLTNATHTRFVAQRHDRDTVATRMRAAGYDTGYFGKYMNGMGRDATYVAPGWGRWVGSSVGNRETVNVDGELRELASRQAVERFAYRKLRRFVRRHRDTGPWFAVWGPTAPHAPYTPSPAHRHDFDDVQWDPPALNEADLSDKPTWMRDLPPQERAEMRRLLEGKLEELQDLDDQIGRLLALLRKTGQLRRTWIFLVSDNGYLLGEHRLVHKEQPYEESSGIPYVVRGPGVRPGTRRALVSQVDLMPTTLDIAGLDPDAGRDLSGRSMLQPLRTGDWGRWRRRLLVENPDLGWAMLREGSTAYIEHHERGEWELYDLESDPHQLESRRGADVTDVSRRLTLLRQARGKELRAREV